jgi:hypothetical protein
MRMTEEDWPLVKLRDGLREPTERAVALPEPHAQTQHWAVAGSGKGLRVTPLEPLQAELLRLLHEHPLGEALARLEDAHGRDRDLPVLTQRWLADGMRLDFWSAIA